MPAVGTKFIYVIDDAALLLSPRRPMAGPMPQEYYSGANGYNLFAINTTNYWKSVVFRVNLDHYLLRLPNRVLGRMYLGWPHSARDAAGGGHVPRYGDVPT
eukprot:SAG11_NODE_5449_length_1556_cov_1.273850_2_plen_101_part_00